MSKLHGNRIEVEYLNRNSLNVNGHLIYNTTTNGLEFYNPAGWQSLGSTSPDVKSDYPTPTGTTTSNPTGPGNPNLQLMILIQLIQHQALQQKQE